MGANIDNVGRCDEYGSLEVFQVWVKYRDDKRWNYSRTHRYLPEQLDENRIATQLESEDKLRPANSIERLTLVCQEDH